MNMWTADLLYVPGVSHLEETRSVWEQENILCLKILKAHGGSVIYYTINCYVVYNKLLFKVSHVICFTHSGFLGLYKPITIGTH